MTKRVFKLILSLMVLLIVSSCSRGPSTFSLLEDTSPNVSFISSSVVNESENTGQIAVNVQNVVINVDCVNTLFGASSDTTILPNENIIIDGTTPNCIVTLIPADNEVGDVTVTITLTSGDTSVSDSIELIVKNVDNDAPTISDVADKTINEDQGSGTIAVNINDVDSDITCASLTASSSNTSLLPDANIIVEGTIPNCSVTMTPTANANGNTNVTLTVSDGSLDATDVMALSVISVDDPPVISDTADQTIGEDDNTGALAVAINDVDSVLTCASLTGSSSDTSLLPDANIVISGTAPNCLVTMTPAANQNGSANVSLTVTDTNTSATDTLSLNVTSVLDAPTISDISNQTVNQNNNTGTLAFTISDVDSSVTCASSVSASSSNQTLLPDANITISGGAAQNCDVVLTPSTNEVGTANVTITVSDGGLVDSDSLTLTVVAVDRDDTLYSPNPASNNNFGHSSTFYSSYDVSKDGNTIIVGEQFFSDVGAAVYAYTWDGSSWDGGVEIVSNLSKRYWPAVAVSEDGRTVITGMSAFAGTGLTYIYHYDGSNWVEQAHLSDVSSIYVAMSGDGMTAAVAEGAADSCGFNYGEVNIYKSDGSSWTKTATLCTNSGTNSSFGSRMALSYNGETIAIGAPNAHSDTKGVTYVFKYESSSWSKFAEFVATGGGVSDDLFGSELEISRDGDRVVVGVWRSDVAGTDSGSVYVYSHNGSSWDSGVRLTAYDEAAFGRLGFNPHISDNGDVVTVGSNSAKYKFTYNGSNWNNGVKRTVLADNARGRFSQDGTLLVGGDYDDDTMASDAGAVYVSESPF